MKLKSFGCSFIFGTDLADDGRDLPIPTASNLTWPALLASKNNYNYECLARPGSGNLQIAERVLSHQLDDEPTFFIIGWTWIDRFDYRNSTISNNPIAAKWANWRTLMPIDDGPLAKTYYQGIHSEFQDKLCSLMYIKLTIDTLNQKRIPFLMTYMDDLLFCQKWNYTPAMIDLQNFVRPYMTDFQGQTFLEWSRTNHFPESAAWHPLEQAHQAGFELIKSQFDTILHKVLVLLDVHLFSLLSVYSYAGLQTRVIFQRSMGRMECLGILHYRDRSVLDLISNRSLMYV
jgi:hypothetical protein